MPRAKKPKVGRPPLGKGETVAVLIKIPTHSRDDWRAAARAADETLSDYVRSAVEAHIARGSPK